MPKHEYEVHRVDEDGKTTFRAEEGNSQQFLYKDVGPDEVLQIEENDSEILVYLVTGPIYYLLKKKYETNRVKSELRRR